MDSAIAASRAEARPRRDRRRFPRLPPSVEGGIVAVLVLFVIVAAVSLEERLGRSLAARREAAAEAESASDAAHTVLDALLDAETGQRGYLLTLRESYLAPFTRAKSSLETGLEELERLSVNQPGTRDEVATLRQLATAKVDELERTIAVARERGAEAARALVATDLDKDTMDAARTHVVWLAGRADSERESRTNALRQRERAAATFVTAATIAAALLLGAIAAVLIASRARLVRAQQALRVQSGRLTGTVAQLPDAVAVFDAAGGLLLCNERLFAVTGLPAALSRRGTAWADFRAAAPWAAPVLGGPAPDSATTTEVVLDGRTLSFTRCPMPDGGQMLAVSDITRRVQAEAMARQASKMEAIGQLTGGIAHDFNNLLQVISTNLELVGGRVGEDPWLTARLTAALGGVERAGRLTRHLLAFARRQPLAPESVDPGRLIASMEDMLRRTLGETIELRVAVEDALWPVRADPNQLENSLLNLAINARDAMPGGGRLTVAAANAVLGPDAVDEGSELQHGHYVVLSVSDTGIGMTAQQLGRALEPFYTTKPEGRGTGLGLPMVYGFARQSDGHLKLTSEPGAGTTARLYLPRSEAPASPAAAAPPEAAIHAAPDGAVVMVVEDDLVVRSAAVEAMHGLGYRTIEASSAHEALAVLRGGAAPDLLFTDVVMPGPVPARDMAAEAKRLLPRLAVVFTSGYAENATVHNGRLDADVTLVSKPWNIADLSRRLRQALDGARGAGTLRILLVEDDEMVRLTTAEVLADRGHEVLQAATGAEALDLSCRRPDLVVTDIGLPDMDGRDLADRLAELRPGIRLIIASGKTPEAGHGRVWLEKPFDEARLMQALCAAMAEPPPA